MTSSYARTGPMLTTPQPGAVTRLFEALLQQCQA